MNKETAYFKQKMDQGAAKMKEVSIENDTAFREAIQHCLNPQESLGNFIQRSGLGPAQALTMTPAEITRFVERAMAANREDTNGPASSWRPKEIPKRFILD